MNCYVQECIVMKLDGEWYDIMFDEMKVFIGFYVLFGIKWLFVNCFYWSEDLFIGVFFV